ncbi:MAG: hypothetical protein ABI645_16040 [Pseudomonadota bacterium]
MHRNRISGGWLVAALLLSGCAAMKSHWPLGKAPAPAPNPVSELQLKSPTEGGLPVLQFWERNTLVVDLQNVAATGQVVLARQGGRSWPARIALRMAPQKFEVVEVRGAFRVVLPVAASGPGPVTAELPPGSYDRSTAILTISWGAKGAF